MELRRDSVHLAESFLAEAEAFCGGNHQESYVAIDEVNDLVAKDPDGAWPIVVELVRRSKSDRVLAFVAAGPLEDLIRLHGDHVIDRVGSLASSDSQFRRALTGVWISTPSEISMKIEKLVSGEPRL